jgi:hypothetical protein
MHDFDRVSSMPANPDASINSETEFRLCSPSNNFGVVRAAHSVPIQMLSSLAFTRDTATLRYLAGGKISQFFLAKVHGKSVADKNN